ncbi:MAG TPA: SDR family oxidoreductase [bacterium]|nr:SDR family oxidoreductase [bacterium]
MGVPSMDLEKGSVAIVTGGGTGIGRAVCHALARAGARAVMVNYSRSRDDADKTASELAEAGCEGVAVQADVAREAEVKVLVARTVDRFGRLDVLVNNAGTTRYLDFPNLDAVTDEVWDAILGVNLLGAFYCSRAAAPALRAARGAIVNVASISGHRGAGSSLPYGVSKAALIQLTRGLAVALAPEVRVNSVSPGQVVTRWARLARGEAFARAIEAESAAQTPLGACASPEHVAQAVMGLIQSEFVTGQDLVVDGGRNATY